MDADLGRHDAGTVVPAAHSAKTTPHKHSTPLAVGLVLALALSCRAVLAAEPVHLTILAAGTLARRFMQLDALFVHKNPNAVPQPQFGGSVKMARQITDLHQPTDVRAVADATNTASDVLVGIRAEDIEVLPPGCAAQAENRMTARVLAALDQGVLTAMQLDFGVVLQARMLSRTVESMHLTPGVQVEIAIAPEAIHPMPLAGDWSTPTTNARVGHQSSGSDPLAVPCASDSIFVHVVVEAFL